MRLPKVVAYLLLAASIDGFSQRVSLPPSRIATTALRSLAKTTTGNDSSTTIEDVQFADTIVCGGGPAGLLTAIMLAQKYPKQKVRLFDRLSEPPSPDDATVWKEVAKFYLIGLGGRGQFALKSFGVWDDVEKRCVAVRGRKDWPPDSKEGVERVFSNKEKLVTTQVLPRDKLVGVLHQHILEHFVDQIELNYGYELQPLDFGYADGSQVLLQVSKCTEEVVRMNPSAVMTATEETVDVVCDIDSSFQIATDLLIAADGTVRTVANAMAKEDKKRFAAMNPVQRLFAGKPFYVKRYVDDNQRIYKTVPLKSPKEWRPDLNYSARTKDGRVNFDALPATTKGEYCGVLLLKKDDPLAKADTNPAELRSLMDDVLPQFSALLDDETIASVAKKPVSYLPGFRYAGPRLHQGNRCVILGDCAHTVKPYFGLGANSALEDVQILSDVLDENKHDYTAAVHSYSRQQAGEAKALVRISRELDRPGMVGFITFILPIILDSIFNKQFPKLFQPNVITMLQREAYTFQQVARRKRFDRLGQVGIIGGFMFGACWATQKSIRLVASLLGKSTSFVSFALVFGIGSVTFLRSFAAKYLVAGLAPADVITRMKKE